MPEQHEVWLAHQFADRTATPAGSVAALLIGTILISLIAPGPASALQIRELKSPQSFVAAPDSQAYFISNVNGEPAAKDNNGFITKLDHEGKVVDLHFIQGGRRDAVLHAPKGMAIVGTTLYVADVDALRAFDTETGRPGVTIELSASARRPVTHGLADVVHDGNGILYASDADSNTIYRVDTAREDGVSVLASDAVLAGPRGIALHPKTGHLIVVSWDEGTILDIDGAGTVTVVYSNSFFSYRFKNLDGVDFDKWGNMYVSDFTAGKVWRMTPKERFDVIAEFLPTPAGIGIDRANHLILVPYLYGNAAEMNGLESPIKKRRMRTLADYGIPFTKPKELELPDE